MTWLDDAIEKYYLERTAEEAVEDQEWARLGEVTVAVCWDEYELEENPE